MPIETESAPMCPVCGADARSVLYSGLEDWLRPERSESWTLWRCANCATAHLDPRPVGTALREAYSVYYTHHAPAGEPEATTPVARARRSLRNGYVNKRLSYDLQPSWPLGSSLVAAVPRLRGNVERMFRSLPHGSRVLDVGCGSGDVVAFMTQLGWAATGIDPDEVAVQFARDAGLDVRAEALDVHAAANAGAYDAITISHVLEHVPDPVGFLADARVALRPGGTLWVATPNLQALGHRRYGRSWVGLDPPRHFTLFTLPSLRLALGKAGFEDVRSAPHWPVAASQFTNSARIARGEGPDFGAGAAESSLRTVFADVLASRAPELGEELVLLATAS